MEPWWPPCSSVTQLFGIQFLPSYSGAEFAFMAMVHASSRPACWRLRMKRNLFWWRRHRGLVALPFVSKQGTPTWRCAWH